MAQDGPKTAQVLISSSGLYFAVGLYSLSALLKLGQGYQHRKQGQGYQHRTLCAPQFCFVLGMGSPSRAAPRWCPCGGARLLSVVLDILALGRFFGWPKERPLIGFKIRHPLATGRKNLPMWGGGLRIDRSQGLLIL